MTEPLRSFIRITGDDRVSFLQGILTQDVTKLAADKIQFAALLSPQGKILHDMFLIDLGDSILLDTAAQYKDALLKRLTLYKLRAKVTIEEITSHEPRATSRDLPDPRHPALPVRDYSSLNPESRISNPLQLGIPELGRDFAPDQIVPLDAGYDLLHAISFTKGCYVGQEVTARMHYKHIARRGFFILEDESGTPQRLALLKFEDVFGNSPAPLTTHHTRLPITVDNQPYHARLPEWMLPKFQQFLESLKAQ